MPTYDYRCERCGYTFEIFQGMLEKKLTDCPECGGDLRRLIGPGAGIVFKGSGFYQTDYRSKEYRERAKGERPASGDATPAKGPESPGPKQSPAPKKTESTSST